MPSINGIGTRRSLGRDATFAGPRSPRNDQTVRFRATIPTGIPETPPVPHITEETEVMANDRDESLALLITLLDRVSMPEPASSQLPAQSPSLPLLEVTSSDAPGSSSTTIDSRAATLKGEASCTTEGIMVFGPDGLVNSGTVPGLVKQLAVGFGDLKVDEAFRETFLTSYRAFTSGNEVLRLLVEQFKVSLSLAAEQRAKVQYTIFSVLALWLDEDYVEATNDELLNRMRDFVTCIQSGSFLSYRQQLISLIDKNLDLLRSFMAPLTASPLSLRSQSPSVQDISPQAFAEVLTSIEGDRYRKLKGHDYFCHLEGTQEYNAVSSFMFENRKLTYWVLVAILNSDTQSKRAEDLRKMLLVIKECKRLRNFSSACALAVGVTSTSITCLKRTYGDLDNKSDSIFQEARALIHPRFGHKSYRAALGGSDRGCIPWLYVHRRDLKRIRTNQDLSEVSGSDRSEHINFKRYRHVHEGIRKVLCYQPVLTEPVNPVPYYKARNLMEAQLAELIIDDVKLQDRRARLATEEKMSYDAYRDELSKAGFRVPSQLLPHSPPAARHSSTRSRSSGTLARSSAQMSSSPTDPSSFVVQPSGPTQPPSHIRHPSHSQSPPSSPRSASQPIKSPPIQKSSRIQTSSHIQSPSSSLWSAGQLSSPIQTHLIQASSREDVTLSTQSPNDDDVQTGISPLDVFNKDSEHCLDRRIKVLKHITSGGNADIREGLLGDRKVAIKTIRPFSSRGPVQRDKLLQRLWREYSTWRRVSSHPIVLDCLGFTYDVPSSLYMEEIPSLISPWMSNGDLTEYIKNNPEADRLNILHDVAKGLAFLHEQKPAIIHGDLRGGNILITDSGRPCLSDFGLSKVLMLSGMTTTAELGGTLRWMSPELIDGDTVSAKSDVWAYAMTILEILSGHQPYHEERNNISVVLMVKKGAMPSRSLDWEDLTNEIWGMCQKCWIISPRQRPAMQDVCRELGSLIDNRT